LEVTTVTVRSCGAIDNEVGVNMPVLMIALIALGAFGAIGVLLASAVILEQRSKQKMAKSK
jgi:hypothetical protein